MPSLLDLIALVDNAPPDVELYSRFYTLLFLPDPRPHGFIHPDTLAAIPFPPPFETSHSLRRIALPAPPRGVSLEHHARPALQAVVDAAIQSPLFPGISAHSEPFLVVGAREFLPVERFAASLFGIATRGAHLTAYVRGPPSSTVSATCSTSAASAASATSTTGTTTTTTTTTTPSYSSSSSSSPYTVAATTSAISTLSLRRTTPKSATSTSTPTPTSTSTSTAATPSTHNIHGIWVARRSPHLATYPGLWDSTVAGGVKAHDSPAQCIHDEAHEEASLPDHARALIRPAGALTLANINGRGLFHSEVLYVYDLDLTPGTTHAPVYHHNHHHQQQQHQQDTFQAVVPRPNDSEVDHFALMAPDQVLHRMRAGEFKPNVCPVIIDFMIRHGIITPDNEPEYASICARLHRRLPVPLVSDA